MRMTDSTCHPFLLHWVPLTTSSVTMATRLQRADFFALNSLTAMLQKFGYNEHLLIMSSFFCVLLLVVSGTHFLTISIYCTVELYRTELYCFTVNEVKFDVI